MDIADRAKAMQLARHKAKAFVNVLKDLEEILGHEEPAARPVVKITTRDMGKAVARICRAGLGNFVRHGFVAAYWKKPRRRKAAGFLHIRSTP